MPNFPMLLKPGQKIRTEKQTFKVHSVAFYEKERWGILHNVVFVETTTGCLLSFKIAQEVETA